MSNSKSPRGRFFGRMKYMEKKYQKLKKIVERKLTKADTGHDINHVMRVYNSCLYLAKGEKGIDLEILKTAVLLHDIAEIKESERTCHAKLSAEMAQKILGKLGYSQDKIDKIAHCILAHRYRTGVKPKTKEAKILFDADKLDSLGAIGIARAFIWVERHKAKIYTNLPLKKYIKENLMGGRINGRIKDKTKHSPLIEYEIKLKRVPNRLHARKAKKIAKGRLNYMKSFFDRFSKEIKGGI